jgi:hypothetical protein
VYDSLCDLNKKTTLLQLFQQKQHTAQEEKLSVLSETIQAEKNISNPLSTLEELQNSQASQMKKNARALLIAAKICTLIKYYCCIESASMFIVTGGILIENPPLSIPLSIFFASLGSTFAGSYYCTNKLSDYFSRKAQSS